MNWKMLNGLMDLGVSEEDLQAMQDLNQEVSPLPPVPQEQPPAVKSNDALKKFIIERLKKKPSYRPPFIKSVDTSTRG